MAQLGLHGIIGLAVARAAAPAAGGEAGARRGLCRGLVLGSLLPDTDFFLLLPAYLIRGGAAVGLHRSWSHSLLAALVAALLALAAGRRRAGGAGFALGLGLGMVLHDLTDLLVWFSGVGLLWPADLWGGPWRLHLWSWVRVPRLVSNLLGAADYMALAGYYLYLEALARRLGTDAAFLPRLRRWAWAAWLLFGVYLILAGLLAGRGGLFDMAHYGVLILAFLPATLWLTVRMGRTLEALAPGSEAA
ncbi:MAG: metal-dependent hydrolase [Acetobacteraceae bacterium]|nr:metal-dependent hydrolase [Acetobacteraceae bacterium]